MDIFKLLVAILICELAGGLGSIFNIKAIPRWYDKLKKPNFNPPNWIFGPVWTLLYLLMGISLYFVLISSANISLALIIFGIQLILNIFWSGIFFASHKPGWAFVEIIFMWIFIVLTLFVFYPISHIASYLLVPYLVWVSFASVLNFYVWELNKKSRK